MVQRAEPVDLLTHLLDGDRVVVVDAVAPAGRPGRIHVRGIDRSPPPSRHRGPAAATGWRSRPLADAVEAAVAAAQGPQSQGIQTLSQ